MDKIMFLAAKYDIHVVEDACQAVLATWHNICCGNFGIAGAISLHPLKNLNVWGDGGMIITNDDFMNKQIRLMRNHGLLNRDEIEIFGVNSRLDSVQAAVGNHQIQFTRESVEQRRKNASYLDKNLKGHVSIIERKPEAISCFHLYMFEVHEAIRNRLVSFLTENGIEAKVHYPIPLYKQKPFKALGYKDGDFPMADRQSARIVTLPVDEHLSEGQLDYMILKIKEFMQKNNFGPDIDHDAAIVFS